MKKKVGELYDKPIVIGDPNEFSKDKIPLKTLTNSGEKKNETLYFDVSNISNSTYIDNFPLKIKQLLGSNAQIFKIKFTPEDGGVVMGFSTPSDQETFNCMNAIGFTDVYIKLSDNTRISSIDYVNKLLKIYELEYTIETIPGIKQITEEEFYNLNI